jgi:hypothetical protein
MNDIVPARPAPALAMGESLTRLISDPNITAEKLQLLLQMQKDIIAESRREAFQTAFAAMSIELPQISKEGLIELIKADGKHVGSYKYTRYEDMDLVVRPIMHKHGFGLSFESRVEGNTQILVGKLLHAAGHFTTSERRLIPDPGPGRNALQAEGSGLSYARRYIAEGLLNLVRKGVDDDGIATGLKPINEAQVKQLVDLIVETNTKTENFLRMFVSDCERIEDIPMRDFPRLLNALEEKKRSLAKKETKK